MRGRKPYTPEQVRALQHIEESAVQSAIMSGLQSVPGVIVFDPPPNARGSKPGARGLYRRLLTRAVERFESRAWGAFLWRHNTGGAQLPGGKRGTRPVFFNLTGQHDLAGVLKPSGRLWCREVKRPGRAVLKGGEFGAYLNTMSPEQELWARLLVDAGADASLDPWREARVAVEEMRSLLQVERMAAGYVDAA